MLEKEKISIADMKLFGIGEDLASEIIKYMEKCNELVFDEDVGDGYSGFTTCGGTYEKIGNTQLFQCKFCKKVILLPTQPQDK